MDVKELLQKLEPIVGAAKCREWWLAYLSEDEKGKKQIEQYLQLKAFNAGHNYTDNTIFLPPPPEAIAVQGSYHLGKIHYGNKELYDFLLKEEDLLSHVIIIGRSGSGKTNLALHLINELVKNNKPFWIFDFKRNYRDLLHTHKDLLIYTVGRDVANIHNFNPLVPIGDPHKHIKNITGLLCKAFFLGEGVASLLIKCFDHLYKNFGIYECKSERYPTFRNVQQWLETYTPKSAGRDGQWLQSTMRAIRVLNFGSMGEAVNSQQPFPIKEYLGKRIVFELDALSKQDKIFFIGLLLNYRHEHKLEHAEREKLQDILIIEEAHHLLPKKAIGEEESILETLLREERELGTSFVIIDQMASRLSDVAFANTATTIALNQKHKTDISMTANAIILSQEDKSCLSKLQIGFAVVRQQERWPKPFLIKILHVPIKKGSITDEHVRERMKGLSSLKEHQDLPTTEESDLLDPAHLKFLLIVHQNPLQSIVSYYEKFGFGFRKANLIKTNLVEKALLAQQEIKNTKGRTSFLQLTDKGAFYLRLQTEQNIARPATGIEHLYYQTKIAEMLKKRGEVVEVEPQLKTCRPDILLPDKNIAIEIETGKSKHILTHVKTHLAEGREIIVANTNQQAYQKTIDKLTSEGLYPHEHIRVIIPKI